MMGARIGFGENDTSRYLRVDSGLSRTTVFALTNFRDMFEFLRMQHVMLALQQPQIQSQRAPPHAIQISQIPILGGETKHETRLFQTFQYQYSQCIIWVLKYIIIYIILQRYPKRKYYFVVKIQLHLHMKHILNTVFQWFR